jgi:hypothetical protein
MIVSSPIGDMPFTPERLRLERGAVIINGSMGAWPSRVQVQASDIPHLARLVLPKTGRAWAIPIAGVSLVGLALRSRRAHRS